MKRTSDHKLGEIGFARLLMFDYQIVGANKARVWDDKQENGDESADRANLEVRIPNSTTPIMIE